ncbi:aminoacyl-tRNA hydrolase [Patescibacteria group bacterium]|nr:aminoacyl-tRNA hydrolase [Patescibacteria group bacterium]
MNIIVGLGNPGTKFEGTRHNIGFMVVDLLAREISSSPTRWQSDRQTECELVRIGDVILVKPQVFMNNSGLAVGKLARYYKTSPEHIWLIHDDIDLPLGKIRIREKGGSGGHHGVASVMHALGSDAFIRFRLGIGRGKDYPSASGDRNLHHRSVINFVLSRFKEREAGSLKHLVHRGTEAVRMALTEGLDQAMNRYN